MGPHAGVDLVRKILDNTIATEDQDHVSISLLSMPATIPDRSAFVTKVDGAPNPGPKIATIIDKLAAQGCSVIGMACNTAHATEIYESIVASLLHPSSKSSLLHMIDEVCAYVARTYPTARKVGVLATTATVQSGLYDPFLNRRDLTPVYLASAQQAMLSDIAIRDAEIGIKAQSNPVTDRARGIVVDAIEQLAGQGADVVLLACTELPLAVGECSMAGTVVLDPTSIFARVILENYAPEKLSGLKNAASL